MLVLITHCQYADFNNQILEILEKKQWLHLTDEFQDLEF